MRTLGIDLGTKRIGLAMSDEGARFATPFDVLQVSAIKKAIEPIAAIIETEGVSRVVVGLPLNMDGSIGPAARMTIKWAEELGARVNRPVVFVDERLSSFQAEDQLKARKRAGEHLTRNRKRRSVDALAAAGFLQEFLDGKLAAITEIG